MKHFIIFIFATFLFLGCSAKYEKLPVDLENKKITNLANMVINLSDKIDKNEAKNLAYSAVTFSQYLAQKYEVVPPALFHNLLINLNIKRRGLCYHYANDLLFYLNTKKYKSFKIVKIISDRDGYFEHTSLLITRDDVKFKNSIVLDAWRNTGNLYFSSVKNDTRYDWEIK